MLALTDNVLDTIIATITVTKILVAKMKDMSALDGERCSVIHSQYIAQQRHRLGRPSCSIQKIKLNHTICCRMNEKEDCAYYDIKIQPKDKLKESIKELLEVASKHNKIEYVAEELSEAISGKIKMACATYRGLGYMEGRKDAINEACEWLQRNVDSSMWQV